MLVLELFPILVFDYLITLDYGAAADVDKSLVLAKNKIRGPQSASEDVDTISETSAAGSPDVALHTARPSALVGGVLTCRKNMATPFNRRK